MNDKDIRNAFENMTAGADAARVVYSVQSAIGGKKATIRLRFPRTVIAAVCLMLAMAVSVGAYAVYKQLTIETPDDGPYDYIVKISESENGESELVTLSEEVMEELTDYVREEHGLMWMYKGFETWTDLADWLDCGILTSELFGDVPSYMIGLEPDNISLTSYKTSDNSYLLIDGSNEVIGTDYDCNTTLQIPLTGEISQYNSYAALTGESNLHVNDEGWLVLEDTHTAGSTEVISHTSKSGLQAAITATKIENTYFTAGHVYLDGVIYRFGISGSDKDETVEVMKTIIDSLK